MAASEQVSTLFQVPLVNHDAWGYKRIPSQPIFDPKNCGAATAKLLGLVTPAKADQMTRLGKGASVASWLEFLNSGAPDGIVYSYTSAALTEQSLIDIAKGLFTESGTVILTIPEGSQYGHYYVLAKDAALTVGVLDPQQAICAPGFEQTKEFIQRVHPGASAGTIGVFVVNQPRTMSQALSDYTDGILSRQVADMHIGGPLGAAGAGPGILGPFASAAGSGMMAPAGQFQWANYGPPGAAAAQAAPAVAAPMNPGMLAPMPPYPIHPRNPYNNLRAAQRANNAIAWHYWDQWVAMYPLAAAQYLASLPPGQRRYGGAIRSSLPTRRVGRSSSSKKRRYTHRRRALRTGKGGYRSTGKHRKV